MMQILKIVRMLPLVLLFWGTAEAQTEAESNKLQRAPEEQFVRAIRATGAVYSNLQRYFVDTINLEQVNALALNNTLQLLDPYTEYLSKEEVESFAESTTGNYGGVGALISQRPDSTVIFNEPFEGQPAALAGIKAGDRILSVDGKDFTHAFTPDVSKALRGPEGSTIRVTVRRKGQPKPLDFVFKRKEVYISPVAYCGMLEDGIGLIRLASFMQDAGAEFRKSFTAMMEEYHPKAFILDLRGNGGGVLQSAVDVISLFVPKGTLAVSVKGRRDGMEATDSEYRTTSDPIAGNIPMVVLIDNGSASSSEIVAGAMQDLDRAVIMGDKSYGKGLVQSTIRMPDEAMLKLTTAHYYTPSGRSIQKISYNHLGQSGSIVKAADSLGTAYTTASGRKVYSSGGITPDVSLAADSVKAFVGYLAADTLVFDWVVAYESSASRPIKADSFALTDEEYNNFCQMLKDKGYVYKPYSLYVVEMLEKVLTTEGTIAYYQKDLDTFKKQVEPNIAAELERNKADIKQYLEGQIILRRNYRRSYFAHMLPRDKQVKAAVAMLKDPARMASLLAK